jgi:hypothetical protein
MMLRRSGSKVRCGPSSEPIGPSTNLTGVVFAPPHGLPVAGNIAEPDREPVHALNDRFTNPLKNSLSHPPRTPQTAPYMAGRASGASR